MAPTHPAARHLRGSVPRLSLVRVGSNEAVAASAGADEQERLVFRCECDGDRCLHTVSLTRSQYAWARRHRGWLLVSPGHQVGGAVLQQRLGGCFVLRREAG